jgi:hypothetical protein
MELDLTRPRDLGDILGTCFKLYGKHFGVFAAIAFSVVIPLDLITVGLIDEQLTGYHEDRAGGGAAYTVCYYLLSTPLITAGHVAAVMQIGAGKAPSIGASLSRAGRMLLPVMAAVVIAGLGTIIGFVFLVVPGVFLYVRWFVAAQSVVAEDLHPFGGLSYSWDLVSGNWWRVFGISIVIGLIAGVVSAILAIPVAVVAALVESGPLLVLGTIVFDGVVLSFAALAGTILFFDLKARKFPVLAAPAPDPRDRPEAPVA